MFQRKTGFLALAFIAAAIMAYGSPSAASEAMPQAPANLSWLPHGYGGNMLVDQTTTSWQKGLHGFRTSPEHIGCWSQPLWGWDVNGFYLGPNVAMPDPVMLQLPIGLIYPVNSPALPPSRPVRKVAGPPHSGFAR